MKVVLLAFVTALAACATSSGGNGDIDANTQGHDGAAIDSHVAIDADPNAPDADVNRPDADPGAPDAGNTCATQPCDILTQCGCNATQACDIDFTDFNGTACRGIGTAGTENDTCAAITDCAGGYVCVGDGTDNSCKQYCDANADCGTPRGQCVIQLNDNTGAAIPGAVVCSSNCDPGSVSNPLCPGGWSCDIFTATYNAADYPIADCRKAGTAAQGAACSATTPCAAGLSCVNNGTSNVCGKICRRPAGTECTGATTCYGFTTPFIIGTQEYGVCM